MVSGKFGTHDEYVNPLCVFVHCSGRSSLLHCYLCSAGILTMVVSKVSAHLLNFFTFKSTSDMTVNLVSENVLSEGLGLNCELFCSQL